MKGENLAPGDKTVYLEKGNTAVAAEFIQKAVGGDIFEIETVKTYKKDYMEMINEAKEEQENGIRVIVFVTSGGGGFGRSVKEMRKICPDIDILAVRDFLGHQVADSEEKISEWARDELMKAQV
ncbi:MAG: hypothetical protein J1E01_01490 [Acetatifactor sp.]|nr:hypothetical protein [Acetatifactor sp.]